MTKLVKYTSKDGAGRVAEVLMKVFEDSWSIKKSSVRSSLMEIRRKVDGWDKGGSGAEQCEVRDLLEYLAEDISCRLDFPPHKKSSMRASMSIRNLTNFFEGLEKGWALFISDKNFILDAPFPPFTIQYKGLSVKFKNLGICFYGSLPPTPELGAYTWSKGKVHSGCSPRRHPHGGSCCTSPPFTTPCGLTKEMQGRYWFSMCLGNMSNNVNAALCSGDLIVSFAVFSAIMKSYNRRGAYTPIVGFTSQQGFFCRGTSHRAGGYWVPRGNEVGRDRFECVTCSTIICHKCVNHLKKMKVIKEPCSNCGKESTEMMPMLCKACNTAGRYTHEKCSVCKKIFCRDCYTLLPYANKKGAKIVCRGCQKRCPVCRSMFHPKNLSSNEEAAKYGICATCDICRNHMITNYVDRQKRKEAKKKEQEKLIVKET
jgi:hypothetical protein